MSGKDFMKRFRFFRPRSTEDGCRQEQISEGWAENRCGQREWEHFYRDRWQYDKKVRSTHGVNCTGSARGTFM